MQMLMQAAVYRKDDGDFYVTYWTGPHAAKLGVLIARNSWSLGAIRDDDGSEDVVLGTALSIAAVGSRLLRLAERIGGQSSLFDVDVHGGAK